MGLLVGSLDGPGEGSTVSQMVGAPDDPDVDLDDAMEAYDDASGLEDLDDSVDSMEVWDALDFPPLGDFPPLDFLPFLVDLPEKLE